MTGTVSAFLISAAQIADVDNNKDNETHPKSLSYTLQEREEGREYMEEDIASERVLSFNLKALFALAGSQTQLSKQRSHQLSETFRIPTPS